MYWQSMDELEDEKGRRIMIELREKKNKGTQQKRLAHTGGDVGARSEDADESTYLHAPLERDPAGMGEGPGASAGMPASEAPVAEGDAGELQSDVGHHAGAPARVADVAWGTDVACGTAIGEGEARKPQPEVPEAARVVGE